MKRDRPLHRDEAERIIDAAYRGSMALSDEARRHDQDARHSGRTHYPATAPGEPRLLRPGHGRSPDTRVLGDFDDVLRTPVPRDALATRFYEALCAISDPNRTIPGRRVSIQMLNTMRRVSDERRMDAEQVTTFAENMAERFREARIHG